jgi:hypothetical protein
MPLQLQGAHDSLLRNTNRLSSAPQCKVQPTACLQCPTELTPGLLQVVVPPPESPAGPDSWPEVRYLLIASLCRVQA